MCSYTDVDKEPGSYTGSAVSCSGHEKTRQEDSHIGLGSKVSDNGIWSFEKGAVT